MNEGLSPAKCLISAVQELSLARDLNTIISIVKKTARQLAGSDGATFVLRDDGNCYYVDEDAIGPLWKGLRFPMSACISGWAMLNRKAVVIEDIYKDDRIPTDAYRPTFVKSLAMVPIRTVDPIGAIGNYWATQKACEPENLELLQALADSAAVALENVQVYAELERRVRDRTAELQAVNKELEAFASAVSHDLRAPVRHISGFCELAMRSADKNSLYLDKILQSASRMSQLIDDLLALSRSTKALMNRQRFDLAAMAKLLMDEITQGAKLYELILPPTLYVEADPELVRAAMTNLLSNAWKYSSKRDKQIIELGTIQQAEETVYFVRDNGAGFDSSQALRLFEPFHRFHSQAEFVGTGIGLATVYRIIARHGGRIWAESMPNHGATFFFTLRSSARLLI